MIHPGFPATTVPVIVETDISAWLILLPVDVVVDSFEFCTWLAVAVEVWRIVDSSLDVVHVESFKWLSVMSQSVIMPSAQSEFVNTVLVLVHAAAKLCSTVNRNGFSERQQDLLT